MDQIKHIESEKLKNAIISMQTHSEFAYYGYFACYFNFIHDKKMNASAGVLAKKRNEKVILNFYYNIEKINEEFVSQDDMKLLVIHEINHILLNHCERIGKRNKHLSNIAQDMLINDDIYNSFNISNNKLYYIPEDYNGKKVFEELYNYLHKHAKKINVSFSELSKYIDGKQLDKHFDDGDVSESKKKQIKKQLYNIHKRLKERGLDGTNISSKSFNFVRKRNTKLSVLKKTFQRGLNVRRTYKTPNRKHSKLKGKEKNNKEINLLIDTSGSFFDEIDYYMSYVVNQKMKINLYQCDTDVTSVFEIKSKGDWKKIKKEGCGGTIIQKGINYIINKKEHNKPLVVITDGECEDLNFNNYKGYSIILIPEDRNPSLSCFGKVEKRILK